MTGYAEYKTSPGFKPFEKEGVQLLDMVDNSISLCTSPLGWFFRPWAVRTGQLTLE
jgi:hypothetical protein